MPRMSDAPQPPRVTPLPGLSGSQTPAQASEKVVCERCGGDQVYRMHAVWRCAECGFKTDCCGW